MTLCVCVPPQVKSINSSSSCTCANGSSCWDRQADDDIYNVVNIPVTTPENLYLMGKDTHTHTHTHTQSPTHSVYRAAESVMPSVQRREVDVG